MATGKRRKLKAARVQALLRPALHDRRSTDLLANAQVAPIEVDDPLEHGGRLIVLRSLRDDPLGAMHNAKQVSECQYIAGRHWQKAYELAEIGGARAIDPTREAVDGGGIAQPTISDTQARAFADLSKAARALGDYGQSLVLDVLARHMTLTEIAAARMMTREIERAFIGRRFRECLDTLAETFGYAMKQR